MTLHRKANLWWVGLVLLTAAGLAGTSRVREPLSPIEDAFLEETKTGITILIPFGLDEGVYATLKGRTVTFREKDGASSDNRLAPGSTSGTFELRGGKLILRHDGEGEGVTLKLLEATEDLRKDGVRFMLHGEGLLIGYAPVPLPLANDEDAGR